MEYFRIEIGWRAGTSVGEPHRPALSVLPATLTASMSAGAIRLRLSPCNQAPGVTQTVFPRRELRVQIRTGHSKSPEPRAALQKFGAMARATGRHVCRTVPFLHQLESAGQCCSGNLRCRDGMKEAVETQNTLPALASRRPADAPPGNSSWEKIGARHGS